MEKPKKFSPRRASGNRKFNSAKTRVQMYHDPKWGRFRHRFLFHNPICYACPNRSSQVDHLVPVRVDSEGFYRRGNHVALCHGCHSFVTQKFDRHEPPKTEDKKLWMQEKRKLMNLTHPIKAIAADDQ